MATILAYWHLPFVRITDGSPKAPHAVMCRRTLSCGIDVAALAEGIFIFDFRSWKDHPPIDIPAWELGAQGEIPTKVMEAEQERNSRLYEYLNVMNAHVLCLHTAVLVCQRTARPLHLLITPDNYFIAADISDKFGLSPLEFHTNADHAFIHLNAILEGSEKRAPGSDVTVESVILSLEKLEQALSSPEIDLLKLANIYHHASLAYGRHDASTCLVLAWTICERLLQVLWTSYIETAAKTHVAQGEMNKERRKKLSGRDFTASVVSEALALAGVLPGKTFQQVDLVRKRRNDWMHGLKTITFEDAAAALRAAESMLHLVAKFEISISPSRRSRYFNQPIAPI